MKKLSLIMAMVLIATIGGVYATWTFSGNDVNAPHEHAVLRMEDYTQSGSLGTLVLNAAGATISIDEDENVTHKAKIVISGDFIITFKPNDTAPETVKNQGIDISYTQIVINQAEPKKTTKVTKKEKEKADNFVEEQRELAIDLEEQHQ